MKTIRLILILAMIGLSFRAMAEKPAYKRTTGFAEGVTSSIMEAPVAYVASNAINALVTNTPMAPSNITVFIHYFYPYWPGEYGYQTSEAKLIPNTGDLAYDLAVALMTGNHYCAAGSYNDFNWIPNKFDVVLGYGTENTFTTTYLCITDSER